MITQIKNYTFNQAAKTITFPSFSTIDLFSIKLIVNQTTNTIIFNFAKNGLGGTVAANVLTLVYDTSSMNNTDNLAISYDIVDRSEITKKIITSHNRLGQDYPNLIGRFFDDNISAQDCKGWSYHNQYDLSVKRGSPTIATKGYYGENCFEMAAENKAGSQVWLRKSQGAVTVPIGVKKVVIGCDWSWHAWWLYGLYAVNFAFDFQKGPDYNNPTGNRFWFKTRWVRSVAGTGSPADNKWQYDSITTDSTPSWTDIPASYAGIGGGGSFVQPIPWNEPYKNQWAKMAMVLNLDTGKYEKLYTQDITIDMSSASTNSGTVLSEYQNGGNYMYWVETRSGGSSTSTNMSSMYVQNPFLAFIY
jgi:hypothetical protein